MRTGGRESLQVGVRLPTPPAAYDPQDQARLRSLLETALARLQRQPAPPRLTSIDLTYDVSAGTLSLKAVGGPDIQSALFEIADNASFTSPLVDATGDFTDGVSHTKTSAALGTSDTGKVWYARVTPYSAAGGTGWEGTAAQDTIPVPAPTPTKTPRIASATVENTVAGTCSTSLALKNRVTVSFIDDDLTGYTWDCTRYENGEAIIGVASDQALSTTTVDDEIDAESDLLGTEISISYQVEVSGPDGLVDSAFTQALTQPRTACP